MLRRIENNKMGKSNLGWLNSSFHFSFADYFNALNVNFGFLRVLNDDVINPMTGFDTHPHKDMEIVTYVVSGELTHSDSMGNEGTVSRGDMQYMSAGTGIYHSEHNLGDESLRLLQIWIIPDKKGHTPNYGDYKFRWEDRENNWLHMISNEDGVALIKIHQDVNIYALSLDEDKEINFHINDKRQAYLVQIEGSSEINNIYLNEKDALEVVEENILIKAKKKSHFILIEMKKNEGFFL